jgi:ADP-heptose:LPS heptosyltransferase
VENWIGRLSLVELAAVLDRAALMIGADSGPAHMAAAVGTPTVVLFSGTNCQEQWRPPGEHVTVLAHDVPCRPCHQKKTCPVDGHPCMTGITPEQVAEAVRKRTEDRGQRTEGAAAPR